MYGKNIENNKGRGLLLYIKKEISSNEVEMTTEFDEKLFVHINLNNNDKLLVGLIYRSPSEKDKEKNAKLNSLIQEACSKGYTHILMMGDFNYPDIDWNNYNSKGDRIDSSDGVAHRS